MSSLTDRTDDVRIVDAPNALLIPKEWQRQYHELKEFYNALSRKAVYTLPVPNLGDLATLQSSHCIEPGWHKTGRPTIDRMVEEHGATLFSVYSSADAWHKGLGPIMRSIMEQDPHFFGTFGGIALPLSEVTKSFLTFCRKGNYQWYYDKCVNAVKRYEEVCEVLEPYNKVITPKLTVPKFDSSMQTPFILEAVEIVTAWKDERYDYEKGVVRMKPSRVAIVDECPRARRILTSIHKDGEDDDDTWWPGEVKELYPAKGLLNELRDLIYKYDIEEAWHAANAALESTKKRFYPPASKE